VKCPVVRETEFQSDPRSHIQVTGSHTTYHPSALAYLPGTVVPSTTVKKDGIPPGRAYENKVPQANPGGEEETAFCPARDAGKGDG